MVESGARVVAGAHAAIAALQRLDDGRHAGAERSLDHDGVARLDGGKHLRFERGRGLGIAPCRPGGRASHKPRISGPQQNTRSTPFASTGSASSRWRSAPLRAELQHVAEDRDAPTARPHIRLAEQARAQRASRPGWHCSFHRSAAPCRRAVRACSARRARSPAAVWQSASAASARSAPTRTVAASTASELSTRWRPGAPSL